MAQPWPALPSRLHAACAHAHGPIAADSSPKLCADGAARPAAAPSTALKSPARPICSGSASKPSSAPRPSVTARMAPTPSGGTTLTTILDATQQQQQQQALQDLQARQLELEQQLPAAEPATSTVERPNPSRAAVLVQPPQPASASAPPAPPPAAEVAPAQGPSSTGRARLERGGDQAASVQEAFTPGREGLARRTIFNRISRHYDEVRAAPARRACTRRAPGWRLLVHR